MEELYEKILDTLNKVGIVTREEITSIDSRTFCENVSLKLTNDGFENYHQAYAQLENCSDYTYAIYDENKYSNKEAIEYLLKNVL